MTIDQESLSPIAALGRLFNYKPSKLSGTLNSIHYSICHELEPEPASEVNINRSQIENELRTRSDSASSGASVTTSVKVGGIETPTSAAESVSSWHWPERSLSNLHTKPVSVPVDPSTVSWSFGSKEG